MVARLGPVARVGLDTSAWDDAPGHLVIGGRTVHIDWSAVDDSTMIVTRGDQDHFSFLVIPPQAGAAAARTAMAMAGRTETAHPRSRSSWAWASSPHHRVDADMEAAPMVSPSEPALPGRHT
ncbi:DUF5994 family protein [Streptomyces sp. NPDC057460]|uniref:DUF5994 family protein n=1 Tax=Streptomyces sp. NPDC057460 TaxID=3346141 RepID=UPI00369B27E3